MFSSNSNYALNAQLLALSHMQEQHESSSGVPRRAGIWIVPQSYCDSFNHPSTSAPWCILDTA